MSFLNTIQRHPTGYTPGAEFQDHYYGVKLGVLTRVDPHEMLADVKILSGGVERYEIDLTQSQAGPRSFWGGVPEVNSLVLVGYRRYHKQLHEAVILGYLPTSKRSALRFDPFNPTDPSSITSEQEDLFKELFSPQTRFKRLLLQPGDVGGMSAAGSELVLSKDVRIWNRAGDGIEIRDAERALILQGIHVMESHGGFYRIAGPTRRSAQFLPPDIFNGDILKEDADRYFGQDYLERWLKGGDNSNKYFNNYTRFPPITLSNGKQVYYCGTVESASVENPKSGSEPYVEDRLELTHTTDLVQDVREEIDGFQPDRRPIYIERVIGTVVGNDLGTDQGRQQYGAVLRPKIFGDFQSTGPGSFGMEPVVRSGIDDSEANSSAGAFLFKLNPPGPTGSPSPKSVFGCAVSKQGKLFLNVPGSRVDHYSSGTKNVSAEVNLEGALKMRLGASKPDGIAWHLTLEGGAVFDFKGSANGAGLQFRTHSSYTVEARGVPDLDNIAYSENLQGNRRAFCSGDSTEEIKGAKIQNINGGNTITADRQNINVMNGYGLNAGSVDVMVSGKTQNRYAQSVSTTIVTQGSDTTVMQGDVTELLLLGDKTIDVIGGSMETSVIAGHYKVDVLTGGIQMSSTIGAVSISSSINSISTSSGLGTSITAGTTIDTSAGISTTISSPLVSIGSAAAALGVARATPMMPPNSPSMCWITGAPLMGCAVIRSV